MLAREDAGYKCVHVPHGNGSGHRRGADDACDGTSLSGLELATAHDGTRGRNDGRLQRGLRQQEMLSLLSVHGHRWHLEHLRLGVQSSASHPGTRLRYYQRHPERLPMCGIAVGADGTPLGFVQGRRYFRVLPGFFAIFCLLAAEQQRTVTTVTNSTNSMGWDEHLNNVEDFSQQ